ncbi:MULTISPECIES: hypothetical protein [Pseudoalteromonas]|uniref:hypothetical protein n=1 Tax=Pseudoalteromonas TaxID=53246 RepID=UPI0030019F20
MNINATILGQFIIILAIVMAALGFFLGKRKTQTPVLASIIGFFSALVPPLALVYLIVLVCKKDIDSNGSSIESSNV